MLWVLLAFGLLEGLAIEGGFFLAVVELGAGGVEERRDELLLGAGALAARAIPAEATRIAAGIRRRRFMRFISFRAG